METKLTEKEELLLKEKIQEANDYKYAQSSNGSRLIRKIVFAIIGSCWILMFAQGKYQEANVFLKITITCSFIYLLLDVIHYFWDTCSYHHHAQNLELCTTTDYLEHVYKPAGLRIGRRSFIFFILKVMACFMVSGTFIIGMFIEPMYIKTKTSSSQLSEAQTEIYLPEKSEPDSSRNGHSRIPFPQSVKKQESFSDNQF